MIRSQKLTIIFSLFFFGMAPHIRAFSLDIAQDDAGQAGAYLDFAASARSLAMGHAHTAVADDASAGYWNPAGLSQLDQKNLVAQYSALEEDTAFAYLGYAQPTLDWGVFGASLVSLQSTDFERRSLSGQQLGTFDQSDLALFLSHGYRLRGPFSFGTNLKMVRQEIDGLSDSSFGLDLGFMWHIHPRFQTGLSLKNSVAPSIRLKAHKDKFPRDVRLGTQWKASNRWLWAMDVSQSEDRNLKLRLGTEFRASELIALRMGLNETELTAGLGLTFGTWGMDYSFGYHQAGGDVDQLDTSHRLGLHWKFGSNIIEEVRAQEWKRKGQVALSVLQKSMENESFRQKTDLEKTMDLIEEAVRNKGFESPVDLYLAQGLLFYFKEEYDRSIQSLSEAAALKPESQTIPRYVQQAKNLLSEEQSRRVAESQMKIAKTLYKQGRYQGSKAALLKVLWVQPDHIEATAYLEDVEARITEPIMREMKIAIGKFDRKEYLGAIKHLQVVKSLDPNHDEADKYMALSIQALEKQAGLPSQASRTSNTKQPVYEIAPDAQKSRELYSQGLIFYSEGKLSQAVELWKKALSLDESNVLAKNAYARALTELEENKGK